MTEKEKKAIEYFTKRIDICNENANICDENDFDKESTQLREEQKMTETILNLIKSQQKEMFVKEHINESFKLMINERDKKIVEMDNFIDKLKSKNKELLQKLRNRKKEVKKLTKYSLYKKEFATLNKQLQQKDKMIDEMIKAISEYDIDYADICKKRIVECDKCEYKRNDCIREYFERKVKDEN